jgi:flagellar biosynthesis protein FlhF
MMNVKKYRAATTREALEMIKEELGADAFVLDTKQVRTGGFLGFRSNMQIEVSAAAPGFVTDGAVNKRARQMPSTRILNLTDDAPAAPRFPAMDKVSKKEAMISALSARASSSTDFESTVSGAPKVAEAQISAPAKIEPVEISSEAPKVVHARKEMSKPVIIENTPEIVDEKAAAQSSSNSSRDFDLLRAELREVKFSLGAFANRQNANAWQADMDVDIFSEVFDAPFYDVYNDLMATGLSHDLARKFVADIIPFYKNTPIDTENLTRTTLMRAMSSILRFAPEPMKGEEPLVMAVIGATGVGKTTTVAKLAARSALYDRRRVELVTLDTYRIAAVEQLKTYAEIIGAGCHVVRSVFELDAVLRRLPQDATVLIDTTGRSPHDLADQYELSEYLQNRDDIRKCLAVQATTHPIDAAAAIRKFEMYGADCLTLTKMDETMRPGAMLELVAGSTLPLAFLCNGQRVPEDLQVATANTFTDRILGLKN